MDLIDRQLEKSNRQFRSNLVLKLRDRVSFHCRFSLIFCFVGVKLGASFIFAWNQRRENWRLVLGYCGDVIWSTDVNGSVATVSSTGLQIQRGIQTFGWDDLRIVQSIWIDIARVMKNFRFSSQKKWCVKRPKGAESSLARPQIRDCSWEKRWKGAAQN